MDNAQISAPDEVHLVFTKEEIEFLSNALHFYDLPKTNIVLREHELWLALIEKLR